VSSERDLELVAGSVKPFDIYLYDENDVKENLAAATRATFRVVAARGDTTYIIDIDTGAEVTIDSVNGRLVCQLTQVQADALEEGTYIGQATVEISSAWYYTDPFLVKVLDSIAPRLT